jgi:hypothetical protein
MPLLTDTATSPGASLDLRVASAAADVERALGSLSPPVAKLSCLRSILAEQLGLDMTGPGWPARMLGWLARHRSGPFTWTMVRLTGQPPRISTVPGSERERPATTREAAALGVPAARIWERTGLLTLGTTIAAEVSLRVVPARLEPGELDRIRAGEPCGLVIPRLARTCRAGTVGWPATPAVTSAAVITRPGGVPFGFADELVTAGLCQRLGELT